MLKKLVAAISLVLAATTATSAFAAATFYGTRGSFLGSVGATVTDDYSNPGYVFIQSNAAMSAVLGETDYRSTGWNNLNIVQSNRTYCSGCNGSFELSFTTTSVGTASGVFGVGLDFFANSGYHAFITYGDNSTQDVLVGGDSGFFGLTSANSIKTIHFGLVNGGTTQGGYFVIDNLTIASAPVPEPETYALMLAGLVGVGFVARRRKNA